MKVYIKHGKILFYQITLKNGLVEDKATEEVFESL